MRTAGNPCRFNADGNRLLEQGTAGTTLYLGDTELHADPDGTQTVTRTYSFQGRPVAERIAKEGTAQTVNLLLTDPNGSAEVAINTTTGTVQRRHTDPFGNPRDTTALNWASGHGFLNAPIDEVLNTTHLGAREYDPSRGRFLSVDPVMEPTNPAQSNGYSYGWNSPFSHPDPSGTRPSCLDLTGCGSHGVSVPTATGKVGGTGADTTTDYCSTRACDQDAAPSATPAAPSGGVDKPKVAIPSVSELWDIVKFVASHPMEIVKELSGFNDLKKCLSGGGWSCVWVIADLASYAMPLAKIATVIKGIKAVKDVAKAGETARAAEASVKAADDAAKAAEDATVSDRVAASCGGGSFSPDTQVVMADRSTKPLDQVKVGDKVQATDTKTGKTSGQTVTKVWVNHDTDLMDLRIKTDGGTSTIHATQHHLFWDVTRYAWTEADELAAGDRLRTSDGRLAIVASAAIVGGAADMWDLTVDTSHDFYVVTAIADVLVHNCPVERNSPYGNNGEPPPRANSYRSTDGGMSPNSNAALQRAQQAAHSNTSAVVRGPSDVSPNTWHVDIYNKKGQLLETMHFPYPSGA